MRFARNENWIPKDTTLGDAIRSAREWEMLAEGYLTSQDFKGSSHAAQMATMYYMKATFYSTP